MLRDQVLPAALLFAGFAVSIPVFLKFNALFDVLTGGYAGVVYGLLRANLLVLVIYVGLLVLTGYSLMTAPTGFIPDQDKGYLLVNLQLPDSASIFSTTKVIEKMDRIALETPGVAHTMAVPGQSFLLGANGSNLGSMFVILKPFAERHGHEDGANAVLQALREQLRQGSR